jgi:hypothetical protein
MPSNSAFFLFIDTHSGDFNLVLCFVFVVAWFVAAAFASGRQAPTPSATWTECQQQCQTKSRSGRKATSRLFPAPRS